MAETRGTFVLSEVLLEIQDDNWVPPEEVYLNDPIPNAGYFGGGYDGTNPRSTMDKVTYSSDTTAQVPGASLSVARYGLTATGNSIAGYFGGGFLTPNFRSTMDKVTYAADTTAAVPGANLSVARRYFAATGNSAVGYFGGGDVSGTSSTTDKVTYSTDTTAAVPGAALSVPRYALAATGNSTAGYFGGGFDGTNPRSTMEKVSYASDTTAIVPGAALSSARYVSSATGNSTAGYFGGGFNPPSLYYSTMDKVTYSTDTTAAVPGASLSAPRTLAATGNSTAGYFGGGIASPNYYSTMDKVTYSSDTTVAVPGAALSVARSNLSASSLRANGLPSTPIANTVRGRNFVSKGTSFTGFGYFAGGLLSGGTITTTVDKITYSNDVISSLPTGSGLSSRSGYAAISSLTAAYFGGGSQPGVSSIMNKIDYSTESRTNPPQLTVARQYPAATGNSTAGYFGGGDRGPGTSSTMEKVSYSSETPAVIPGAALTSGREGPGATGNSTAGYFGGGYDGSLAGPTSTVNKINYSTDTTALVPSALLSVARTYLAATGNSTAGYFGGGQNYPGPAHYSTTDKLTYSTDTISRIISNNLNAPRGKLGSAGNSTAGYFGGGFFPGPWLYSTMDKLDYSIDIATRIPSANLSSNRQELSASSSTANGLPQQNITPTPQAIQGNTGYFGGGARSIMDKITYLTDTTVQVPGANLINVRYYLAATGSSTTGYFAGGYDGSSTARNTIYTVNYSSDTNEFSGTSLSVPRYALAATGNSTAGYFGGGQGTGTPGVRSTMDKVTYSTTTLNEVTTAALSAARYNLAATGNSTAGYFGGGPVRSTMDKVTYSSDTTAQVPGASLSVARKNPAATGNSIAGYFGGGGAPGSPNHYSTIDKLTYSTDTTAAVPGAALSAARYQLAATGNSTAGYFGGGNNNVGSYSTMNKVTYSSDTTSTIPGSALTTERINLAASSSTANAVRGTVPQVSIV